MKLEEGKKLLKQGKSATAIAGELHFSSTPHFSMAFKKQFGISPMQYKKVFGRVSIDADFRKSMVEQKWSEVDTSGAD